MKRSHAIFCLFVLCGLSARAQDRSDGFFAHEPVISDAPSAIAGLQIRLTEPMRDLPLRRDEVAPIRRERLRIRRAMQERAEQSVPSAPRPDAGRRRTKEAGLWRLNAGNNDDGTRSPYPDRALDARTLRFPAPRGIRPDTRPEPQQRLEKLKRK